MVDRKHTFPEVLAMVEVALVERAFGMKTDLPCGPCWSGRT